MPASRWLLCEMQGTRQTVHQTGRREGCDRF